MSTKKLLISSLVNFVPTTFSKLVNVIQITNCSCENIITELITRVCTIYP